MKIQIKAADEIAKMRVAGRLAAEVLEMIGKYISPGVSTEELDDICHDYIVNTQKAIPAPLNYRGFPKSICTSVNHVVCHGIPSRKVVLRDGDIVNIDVTVIKDGYHGDTSKMFYLGNISPREQKLVSTAYQCMSKAITMVRPGIHLGDLGHAIQNLAEQRRFSVVREYCGHGIGRNFHEEPQVLHFGRPGTGVCLTAGMTFTIEPMINMGKRHVKLLEDNWTVITRDKQPSAQWEHTVLVTDTGYEVLTLRQAENLRDKVG